MVSYEGNIEKDRVDIEPTSLGINQNMRAISFPEGLDIKHDIPALAEYTVKLGKEALSGEKGMFYDGLVLSASLILWHTKKVGKLADAAQMVREVLNSGKALDRLK
jgi:anthranilate phosphoribosyltransferase